MLPYLSKVSIWTVALCLALEISIIAGQAHYRLTQFRPGRPMKLPQLKSGPECPTPYFPNGVAKPRQRNKMIRFTCVSGFQLVGNTYSMCEKGRWDTSIPICIRSGCSEFPNVDNGQISYEHGQAAAMLFCSSGYQVAGPTKAYCNGTHWDRPLGNCRETGISVATSCDFETPDLCGWMNEATHDFDWKRSDGIVSPKALKTGPKFDHTTGTALSGHFMMVDSVEQFTNETARLLSPIYPANYSTNACVLFYYHMFGDGVGTLSAYVRTVSQVLDNLKAKDADFTISGNQRNVWNEAYFDLKPFSESFQIVIEASLGMKSKSDIAIDDVYLLNGGNCRPKSGTGDVEDSSMEPVEPPPEVDDNIFKLGSCANRCGQNVSSVIAIPDTSVNFIQCDCFEDCIDSKTCCPDYAELCVFNDSNAMAMNTTSTTTTLATPRTRPTTISTSSTTTITVRTTQTTTKPTTTPATTSTTTQRIIPTTSSSTTSTTSKPTTTSNSPTTTTTKTYNLRPRTTTTTSTLRPLVILPMVRTRKPTTKQTSTTAAPTTQEVQLRLIARIDDASEDLFSPSMLELGDTKPNLARVFLFSGISVVFFGCAILLIVFHIRRNSGANVLNRLKQKSMKNHSGNNEGFEDVRFLAADEHLDFSIPDDEAEEALEERSISEDAGEKVETKSTKKTTKKGKK